MLEIDEKQGLVPQDQGKLVGLEHTLCWNRRNWWRVTALLSQETGGTVDSLVLVSRGLEANSEKVRAIGGKNRSSSFSLNVQNVPAFRKKNLRKEIRDWMSKTVQAQRSGLTSAFNSKTCSKCWSAPKRLCSFLPPSAPTSAATEEQLFDQICIYGKRMKPSQFLLA